MGRRVYFYENATGKCCKELLSENYSVFRQWFLEEKSDSSDDPELLGFLLADTSDVLSFAETTHGLGDELLLSFINCFSDEKSNRECFFKEIPISVYAHHYEDAVGIILGTRDSAFSELWDIILSSRSVFDGSRMFAIGKCAGYMTAPEQRLLKEKMHTYFGSRDAIAAKFQSGNMDITGIECIFDVLQNTGDDSELLFTFDNY